MIKKRITKYWKEKTIWNKISDLFFLIIVVAMLFPQGRMTLGAFVNQLKAKITNPTIISEEESEMTGFLNWELIDSDGKKVYIEDYKGKVLFVNLWATWCPPCIGEMPEIQSLYDEFKDDDRIEFLLVSNENIAKINSFISKKKYTFPIYASSSQEPEVFQTTSIPTTLLISKDGRIIIKETGAANWGGDKMIEVVKGLLK